MTGKGFLGTSAGLVADLSLVLGILVALMLTVGVVMARRRRYHIHRCIQSTAVAINVLQVGVVMVGSLFRSAVPGFPHQLADAYYAVAFGHAFVGSVTLAFGVFVALRANELVPSFLRFHNFKLFMRTAYGLYMSATLAGIGLYVTWYTGRPSEEVAVPTASSTQVVVPMASFAFPTEVVVPVGTTVVWINQDRAPHNAVADDGQTFRSDLLRAGQTFSMVASHVGVFSYYCELHGSPGGVGMSAVLRVVSADQAPSVAAPAQAPTAVRPAATARTAAPGVGELVSDGPGLPVRQGYVDGLRSETEELERQTRLLVAAEATGDPAGVRRKAEHIFNLVAGAADPQFGDLDRDGRVQNAGDGYGLLPNGDQAGYIQAVRTAAETVARSAEQPRSRQDDAAAVRTAAQNVQLWATEARAVSLALTRATDLRSTARPIGRLVTLARWMALGNDANADNQLSAVPGEGGARVAYDYAHHLVEASQSTR